MSSNKYITIIPAEKDCFDIPIRFNFPFNHEPNEISLLAAESVKNDLRKGLVKHSFDALGKMFGVLVVEGLKGEIGFLRAYSGKLDKNTSPEGYVPPVFDVHHKAGFFKAKEKDIDALTKEITVLESSSKFLSLRDAVQEKQKHVQSTLSDKKQELAEGKEGRKKQRALKKHLLSTEEYLAFSLSLNEQSKRQHLVYKKEKQLLEKELHSLVLEFEKEAEIINNKKKERAARSANLQKQIFESYSFFNAYKEEKNLIDIFEKTAFKLPPSGAGECCAPRLLQCAYAHDLRPLCFTEFWWGASPDSEIRVHNKHYPACRGKCGPILSHMLEGVLVDVDPLSVFNEINGLNVLYNDDAIIAVEKPADLLSVPGKEINYSLASLIKKGFPEIEGPGLVHRLDYETSGVVLVAKSLAIYTALQKQFTSRSIEKKYVALLEAPPLVVKGKIELPLRVDLYNRPRQMVCFEHGKTAITEYRQINKTKKGVRVEFYPLTGRTHQLRVHAAHKSGLNSPIIGDSLYGSSADRLFLHAEEIKFKHPVTGKSMTLSSPAPF